MCVGFGVFFFLKTIARKRVGCIQLVLAVLQFAGTIGKSESPWSLNPLIKLPC